jgi:rhodanese-related sulfurtransferase
MGFPYEILIILLLLLSIFLSLYTLHKSRRINLMQYDQVNELNLTYHQIQAFIALHHRLGLDYALPPLRGWAASPDILLLLAEHVNQHKPEIIVECSSGASSIVLAQCAKQNGKGHVYSLEHDSLYAEKTRQELIKQNLQDWVTVIDAPVKPYVLADKNYRWYTLNEEIQNKQIDMIIIDGPPNSLNQHARYPAGPLLFPSLSNKAAVFLDDTNRTDERETVEKWLLEFPNLHAQKHNCEKGAVSLSNFAVQ